MEFYKRQILIDPSVTGDTKSYYLQIFLTQEMEDIGIYDDDEETNTKYNVTSDPIR